MLLETIPYSNKHVTFICKNIVTKDLQKNIQKIVGTKEKTTNTLKHIFKETTKYTKQIWQHRCEQFIIWEESNQIKRTDKRKKIYHHSNPSSTTQTNNTWEKIDKANKYTELAIQNYLKHGINTIISNFNITATLTES